MAFYFDEDHWAFLEDIEAPMWVDLTLEANSNNQDNDDKWFYTSHQFHHCSSSQLKSTFFHSGDGDSTRDFDLTGLSSPKLPASVSKSRGKQYRIKKWKGENQNFSVDKPHPVKVLTGKSSRVKLGLRDKKKHKLSFIPKETSVSKSSVVCESSLKGKAVSNGSNHPSACEDIGRSMSSEANKTIDSNPTSTVTYENESGRQKQNKANDVSSKAFGHTNGLLSAMKMALRKSYITRPAARMEINNDARQIKGRNSTSSKSSVGSSSNPRHDVRISTSSSARPKEITPESRNMGRITYVAKSKISSGIVKAPRIKMEEGTSNNRRGGSQGNPAKSTHQEAARQKVLYRPSHTKALVPSRVNEQDSAVAATKAKKKAGTRVMKSNNLVGGGKENVTGKMSQSEKCNGRGIAQDSTVAATKAKKKAGTRVMKSNNLVGGGKENVTGKMSESEKCNGRGIAGGGIAGRGQKGTKQSLSASGRNDMGGTVCLKGKGRGQGNFEKPRNLVHFR
ncbi:uncharacterized protein LOC21401704 [Morus notabilis]|uniref:uncharacterized protein LOC21401704 n=1 Tax=Morus notabilis TaxID=981085 RepID=UPI000CED4CAB|nr:uncharacterized protein LOC21401704 [Morus notabilis]